MAEIIPSLNRETLGRMTAGEKRLAERLRTLLEDDYLVWYDIPVGRTRRYPDFIILHPGRGILFLEVKDWKPQNFKRVTKTTVELLTSNGLVTKPHPLEQARQYAYRAIDVLSRDRALTQTSGPYRGKLAMPYGWGVVFANITRRQIQNAIPDTEREILIPDHLSLYKDDIAASAKAETFQSKLWGMFTYQFGGRLTLPQIDRIRWHLFPEVRIGDDGQTSMFSEDDDEGSSLEETLPDIVKVMDIQQELLAKSLGDGHRVIHGVSGSGKTLILGYRCLHLAQAMAKPILVLCFNITLAAKLRSFIASKGVGDHVQIYHFHDWCAEQLRIYHVRVMESEKQYFDRQVESVIQGVDKGHIPRAQYGALLIDEGHDFESDWLKLVVQMVDPETNSLLLLYDDAQSIYRKTAGLGFTLSSVGVQAKGRTTILRMNYRNTRQILAFAYDFARRYLTAQAAQDDEGIPLVEPEAAGKSGPPPALRRFPGFKEEAAYCVECARRWHEQGIPWNDIAILCVARWQGRALAAELQSAGIPHVWLEKKHNKLAYDPFEARVNVLTIHSSKGLEFPRVIVAGIGQLADNEEEQAPNARLLYVGMTRAQDCLLLTTSQDNRYSREMMETMQN